eukprot:gene381-640_t
MYDDRRRGSRSREPYPDDPMRGQGRSEGRSEGSSRQAMQLEAESLPEQEFWLKNAAYVNKVDYEELMQRSDGSKQLHVDCNGFIFACNPHPTAERGKILFNKMQRTWARFGLREMIVVKPYKLSRGSELGYVKAIVHALQPAGARVELEHEELTDCFLKLCKHLVITPGQILIALMPEESSAKGFAVKFTIDQIGGVSYDGGQPPELPKGLVCSQTQPDFKGSSDIMVAGGGGNQTNLFRADFNFEQLEIGGLSKEFGTIFRRAFASRVFPPKIVRDLGLKHVRGMILHGPPGTGKTLIARQLAKTLQTREPKIVNGPEMLNKYVGESEKNIRELFADAEKEQAEEGDNSQLHIVIFDEFDSLCKKRGTSGDTGVGDSVVNQLLAKIDGIDSLNNILLIGMTNRLDMLDRALLRPGRFEVHVEVSLPNEEGRVEILNIHTRKMREKKYMSGDVSLADIAKQSKNFSGAEIEGLVRSATSYAFNRNVDISNLGNLGNLDAKNVRVCAADFDQALEEIVPAFGASTADFENCLHYGIVDHSAAFRHVVDTCLTLLEQVSQSDSTPVMSILLHGPPGCGKTALGAHIAQSSEFPFLRYCGPNNFVGMGEATKLREIETDLKVFPPQPKGRDAYKSDLSLIVLDDVERLLDYVRIGPRFSNAILQTLMVLVKKAPPNPNRKIVIIGTTSDADFLKACELYDAFNVCQDIPLVTPHDIGTVIESRGGFSSTELERLKQHVQKPVGISRVFQVAEMVAQKAQNTQQQPDAQMFLDCFQDCGIDVGNGMR